MITPHVGSGLARALRRAALLAVTLGLAAQAGCDGEAERDDDATDAGADLEGVCVATPDSLLHHAYQEGAARTRGIGRVELAGGYGRLWLLWTEERDDGMTHVLVADSDGAVPVGEPIDLWRGVGSVSDLALIPEAADRVTAVFTTQAGSFGDLDFDSTVWAASADDGVAAEPVRLIERAQALQASGAPRRLLVVDFETYELRLVTVDDGPTVADARVLVDDLRDAGYDWAALSAVGDGFVLLVRDADDVLHHVALDGDGAALGPLVATEATMRFAQPERVVGVGDGAVAVLQVVDPTDVGGDLVLTVLDAADGTTRARTVVATGDGTPGDFEAAALVDGAGDHVSLFYTRTDPDSVYAEVWWAAYDASGAPVGDPERVARVEVFHEGAGLSGLRQGSVAALGSDHHLALQSRWRIGNDVTGELDDEFEVHHASRCSGESRARHSATSFIAPGRGFGGSRIGRERAPRLRWKAHAQHAPARGGDRHPRMRADRVR
ncbi:MAG: hypothetical protein M3680_32195 [Myxococcota bacterium]|nr:hypothetical protein [Myxococcota bacterium]